MNIALRVASTHLMAHFIILFFFPVKFSMILTFSPSIGTCAISREKITTANSLEGITVVSAKLEICMGME